MEGMLDEVRKQVKECKEKFIELSNVSEEYLNLHDEYYSNIVKDGSLLKSKIKERIVGVINED